MAPFVHQITELDANDLISAGGLPVLAQDCAPIVIRQLCASWPIVDAARNSPYEALSHLRRLDAGLSAEAFIGMPDLLGRYHYGDGPGGFNFARVAMTVRDGLRRIADNGQGVGGETAYLGSLPADTYFPDFALENACPLPDIKALPRLWIGNMSIIACHYDVYDNLACVAAGRRRFTLYPPDAIADLYVGPIDHTLAGQPVSLAAGAEDDGRYPHFASARARSLVIDLAPGDALYVPKLWWHQVEALDPVNILVNYWWDGFSAGPDAPYTTLLLAMIAIAERPVAERAAWRAYFDHYVFRQQGHPLAHLPPDKHGILGPLADGNYGRIRSLVMRLLRGQ
jgi:hypothetical protein